MNRYLSALDMLLDYAEDESTVGEIGGMINHSEEYNKYRDIVEKALLSVEKLEEDVQMDIDLFIKAVCLKGLIENNKKAKAFDILKDMLEIETDSFDGSDLEFHTMRRLRFKQGCSDISEDEYNLLKEVL